LPLSFFHTAPIQKLLVHLLIKDIRRNLKAVGGKAAQDETGRKFSRYNQLKLDSVYSGSGVVKYAQKALNHTALFTNGKLITTSREAKWHGEELYDKLRKIGAASVNEELG